MLRTLVYVATARGGLSRWRSAGHLGAISTSATASHRSPCFGTIRLWYDIAVFVAVCFRSIVQDIAVTTALRSASYLGAISTPAPRPPTLRHTESPCVALVRYDSGMTSPFSQLCFRSIVHDIAAAMSRRPVCYHTFAKSLRFPRHHTQLPFEMQAFTSASGCPMAHARRAPHAAASTLCNAQRSSLCNYRPPYGVRPYPTMYQQAINTKRCRGGYG